MKIAQVAPVIESVPPKTYGGTERVVHYLTEALVAAGHDVTLFASGDSRTSADLFATIPESIRLSTTRKDPIIAHMLQMEEVVRHAHRFDIIHYHTDFYHFPVSRHLTTPHVTTLHGRLDLPELQDVYHEFADMPVVSISNHQRTPLPQAHWVNTVYNGIPDTYTFHEQPGEYLVFLGRFCAEKGPEEAIQIALQTGYPLKMAAKVDPVDAEYFESRIRPLLDHPLIEYIGEVNEQEKNVLLSQAYALLFPIQWPEPFGMVMTESMACGTPVIAFERGAVPEVMQPGVTGFIVHSVEEAIQAVFRIRELDRRECRRYFESRHTSQHMAQGYLQTYCKVMQEAHRRQLVNNSIEEDIHIDILSQDDNHFPVGFVS